MLPPKYNMEIEADELHLREYNHQHINHPIDIFFRSLAKAYENRAVAIILSGTGSDGTNGIRQIKERNGLIIAQAPESAKFDGMPRSAIATGFVDLILNPDSIAREMAHISRSMADAGQRLQLSDGDLLSQVFSILKNSEPPEYRDSGYVISRTIFDSEIPLYQRQNASDVEYLSGTVYSENLSVAVQVYDYETYEDIDFQAFGWSKEMVPLEIEVDSVRSFWRQTWQLVHQYAGIILICGALLGLILVPLVAVLVAFLATLVRKVRRSNEENKK